MFKANQCSQKNELGGGEPSANTQIQSSTYNIVTTGKTTDNRINIAAVGCSAWCVGESKSEERNRRQREANVELAQIITYS